MATQGVGYKSLKRPVITYKVWVMEKEQNDNDVGNVEVTLSP